MNSTGAAHMPKKSTCPIFCVNLGQTAEDSETFTNIWLSSKGLINAQLGFCHFIQGNDHDHVCKLLCIYMEKNQGRIINRAPMRIN